jgi:protein phosphatase
LATSAVHYASAAASDRGRKRASNEDAFGLSAEHGVYLVCDGMGGGAAGEVASSMAVAEVLRQLSHRAKAQAASFEDAVEEAIGEAIAAANQVIYRRSLSNPRLRGMGTTLVGLMAEAGRVLVFNVGDSRCYRLRNLRPEPNQNQNLPESARPFESQLEQITLDHSLVAEQVRMGRMTPAEARSSPLHSVITRALGTESTVEPDLFALEAEPGDLFLLCSDGLTNELADPLIASILAADLPLDELCALLIDAANRAGGRDNITCLLVRAEG